MKENKFKKKISNPINNNLDDVMDLGATVTFTKEKLFQNLKKRQSKSKIEYMNKIIEPKNQKIIFDNILNEFSGRNSIIKRVFSMPNISNINLKKKHKKHNQNFINKLNNKIQNKLNEIIEKNINNIKNNISNYNISNNNINNNINTIIEDNIIEDEYELENRKQMLKSNSFYKKIKITNNYYEENEKININIFYIIFNKIQKISINLLLKKIVLEDFLKKYADIINHFCQQCFCFIKVDNFFKKIFNCYKYYRKKLKIEKVIHLVDFFNALIIEMIEYYETISKDDLELINKIYNYILSDLIENLNENNINKAYIKKEILNIDLREKKTNNRFGLNYNYNNEKILNVKDNDIVIIEKDKYFLSEKIYNEKEEMDKFINNTFINNIFNFKNNENYFINSIEKMIMNIKQILSLFKCKNPIDELPNARNLINFYKYMKRVNINNHDKNVNVILYYDKNSDKRKYLKKGSFSLYDWSVEEIGNELIRVTDKLLNKIEKRELYRAKYLKKDKEKTSPNVLENINYSNNLTTFIIEDIASYDSSNDRAEIIDKWARIAEYCREQKDFNDCFAINSAFNSYFISGLKRTKKKLKTKNVKHVKNFCNIHGNYKNAREEMKQLNYKNEYYYPFLGMILRDINFYEESSKYLINENLINFEKIENIQNLLDNNFNFKKKENTKLQCYSKELNFFEKLEKYPEQYLESIVNEIEPIFTRNNGKKKFKKQTRIDEKYFMNK